MRRAISAVIIVLLALLLVVSCQGNDPFGATTREQVRSEAAVAIADIEAQAAVEQATLHAKAAEATARTWSHTLLMLAIVVVGGVLFGLILYFQGKAYLVRVSHHSTLTLPVYNDAFEVLRTHASRSNLLLEQSGEIYILTDPVTGRRIRALPKQRS